MGLGVAKNVYNIPPWCSFSKVLAQHLLEETQGKPEYLTRYRLLLPTRRACRIMRETFLALNEGGALLLPQMSPLGDVDEEALSLMMFGKGEGFLEIPGAISPLRRQLLLAKLICAMPDYAQGMEHALNLARALAHFIDQVVVEGLDFSDLHKIVPEEFSAHWQITLEFLRIISETWPKILEENMVVDAAQHRNMMLHALSNHWQENPPDFPVIAAGSSGSIPAAAELLRTISMLETGMVIIPGLDRDMNDEAWQYVGDTHPQSSLKTLLERIGVERPDIKDIEICSGSCGDEGALRHKLASAMMLPARATMQWQPFAREHDLKEMTQGLEYYECATQSEEAGVISLVMRETLEEEGRVCALVTPDRTLARRVKGFCRRWGIEVDDSAGVNLTETQQGKMALLLLRALAPRFDPVFFLTLLKTSLCCFGYKKSDIRRFASILETNILRTRDVIHSHEHLKQIVRDKDGLDVTFIEFFEKFYDALSPLLDLSSHKGDVSAAIFLKAHVHVLEVLAFQGHESDRNKPSIFWAGDAGRQMSAFFAQLFEHADLISDLSYEDYIDVVSTLMRDVTLRVPYGLHPRLLILGQLEARLTKADTIILGGVNEGVWPKDTGHDPWMSRPMREAFGLPSQDQKIGFAAHDFVQGFCNSRVVMTRSQKVDGAPTLPSRWLDRLNVLLFAGGLSLDALSIQPYLAWYRALDQQDVKPCSAPEPRPPVRARPSGISVTKVETWLNNPYSIYAHYVLKLLKLDPMRQDSGAALKGTLLHSILHKFMSLYPDTLPENASKEFLTIAMAELETKVQDTSLIHFWWPRFARIADWFVSHEALWRQHAKYVAGEVSGKVDINVDGVPFALYGIADRIDQCRDGSYALIDYKSGGDFSYAKLKKGALPQLPLEALILEGGGFQISNESNSQNPDKVPRDLEEASAAVSYLGYWTISGAQEAGEVTAFEGDVSDILDVVKEGLETLVRVYRDENNAYLCNPDGLQALRYNDYELLSRIKEWGTFEKSGSGGGGE